jgi:hypothetical protein
VWDGIVWGRAPLPVHRPQGDFFLGELSGIRGLLYFCPQTYWLAIFPKPPSGFAPNPSSRVAFLLTTNPPLWSRE